MMRLTSSTLRQSLIACCVAFVLCGCGGGSVAVRSNFAGGPAGAPSTPSVPVKPGQGLTTHYAGSGNLGLAILAVVIVADVVSWTAMQLKQAFGPAQAVHPHSGDPEPSVPAQQKCVHPGLATC